MKQNKKLWAVIIAVFMCTSFISAQTKQEKKEMEIKALKEVVDSKNYKVDVSMAFPQRGRSISLTSPYSLEVKDDSVISYLPYYGRAYSIPYGGGDGLRFEAPISEYNVSYNKKGKAKITLKARTNEDSFNFQIEVYPNGSASINVMMQNRAPIRFSGDMEIGSKE